MWLMGPVAPRHVGSSQTRARTRVPCIGRQILNHCATREALNMTFMTTQKLPLILRDGYTAVSTYRIPNLLEFAEFNTLGLQKHGDCSTGTGTLYFKQDST